MNKVPRWVFRYVGNKTFDFSSKKKDFLPKNDQIWPKIGIFGRFEPGHAGFFGALFVGRLVVVARGLYLARHLFTLLQLCTIACGVDFAEMVKVVENIKKKEVPKFDPEKAHQQDILELKGRVPKLTKEQSIKISLADFTLKTTLGRGGYGKVKIRVSHFSLFFN